MAKLLSPLMSAEARGKVGGTIYNTCRGIKYAKTFTAPANPQTTRQLAVRNLLSQYSRSWRGLSQTQRDAWITYADANPRVDWTGQPVRWSGLNWYIACNSLLADIGASAISSPPSTVAPDAPSGVALSLTSGTLKLAWTAPTGNTLQIDVWLLGPVSSGDAGRLRMAKHYSYYPAESTTPVTLVSSCPAGRWYAWVRVISEATGLTSPWVKTYLDVS